MGNDRTRSLLAARVFGSVTGRSPRSRIPEAKKRHLEALAICRKKLHAAHPDVARSLIAVARACLELEQRSEALELASEALKLRRTGLREDHTLVVEARDLVARACY